MRGGLFSPILLFAALALALAFTVPRARIPALLLALLGALAGSEITLPVPWLEGIFLFCWVTVIVAAACVHLPGGISRSVAFGLGLLTGAAAGAVTGIAGRAPDVALASPALLLVLPAAWLVASGRQIAIKVVASWLIAIALLAAALPLTPTPGYVPDHME